MLQRLCVTLLSIGLFVFLQGCAAATPTPTTPTANVSSDTASKKTLIIGETGSSPSATISSFQPLADYLAANLSANGYGAGMVKVAPDIETMSKWLKNGEIDVFFDSPYPAMILVDMAGAKPILRRWKGGVADYYAILFARKDAKIESINDLKGKMLALEDPGSTAGYMLPKALLVAAGLKVSEKASADAPVGSDEVGYVFVNPDTDFDMIQWVLSSKTPAGVVNSTTFNDFSGDGKKSLVTLAKTQSAARHMVLVRNDLEPDVVEAIKQIMLKMDASAEGQAVLKQFQKTAKFDEFPDGAAAALSQMRELYKLTQQGELQQ